MRAPNRKRPETTLLISRPPHDGDSSHPTVGVARSRISTVVLLRASRWALNSCELVPATVETFWLRTFAPRFSRVGKQILYGCSSWHCVKKSALVFFLVCCSFLSRIFTIYLGFSATLTLTDARKKQKLKDQSWFFFLLPWKASVPSFVSQLSKPCRKNNFPCRWRKKNLTPKVSKFAQCIVIVIWQALLIAAPHGLRNKQVPRTSSFLMMWSCQEERWLHTYFEVVYGQIHGLRHCTMSCNRPLISFSLSDRVSGLKGEMHTP